MHCISITHRYPLRSLLVRLAWYHYFRYSFQNFTTFPLSPHVRPDQISRYIIVYIHIHRLYAIMYCAVFCALLLSRCSKFVNSFVDAPPSNLLATFCSRFTFAKLSIDDRIIISRRWSSSSSSSLSLSLGFTVRSSPLCIQDQITRKTKTTKKK